eukprot:GHRR01017211.1.p1 GENE.GHRR01017211.1~~GHRR01017211.1.p1  ORF type:complete len:133 (+),score=46.94 GHRR01017211.1:766-1164(+)
MPAQRDPCSTDIFCAFRCMYRYFKCLTAIETRFPISNEKGNVRISFPWTDAFRPNKRTSQYNIHFEKAAVLFDVAAVLSQQALQVERSAAEGITQAGKLFQVCNGFMHSIMHPGDMTWQAVLIFWQRTSSAS